MTTTLEPHARVRLICDPTRIGTLTDKTRPGRRGRGVRYQVQFPDGNRYISEDDIEPVPFEREDPLELLERGQIGQAQDMRRVLTHVRLTGRLADVIYSMETTNTDFYTYQFKPVLRFLNSPSNALLIADEVGLGKTIEAGLIWTELRSRFDLRRLLVVCPAMLREKWRSELTRRFGVRAEVLNAAGVLNRLRSPEQTMHGFAMICSMEGLRPPRDRNRDGAARSAPAELADVLRQSREQDDNPLIDLLVIDEAHYLRNPRTQSNELGRLLQSVAEHLLLLTATPIHNHNRDLFTMLHLLDPNTFEREEDLRLTLQAAQPLIQAREQVLKSTPSPQNLTALLRSAASHPQLRGNRELDYVMQLLRKDSQLSKRAKRADLANRLEMVNPLAHVITRTRKRDVKEWRVVRKPCRESVPMKPCEEAFYEAVTERVIDYAQPRDVSERFLLATPQRQMSSSMPATLRAWRKRRENFDELAAAGSEGADELGPLTREMIECVDDLGSVEQLIKHDSKYDRVRTILNQFLRENPGEKTVLFSSFRETLSYLGERLSEDGIPNIVMHGGVAESKDDILDRFRNEPEVRVLLSSEVGSEGIDLQFCRVLVNYDLPWNPMRVEQRIGRLDRLGQKADSILIWNLFYAETIDARIYTRLYEKLDLCRQALGDFEEVLGNEVRKLGIDLLTHHFTPEQQKARIDQTAQAMANVKHEQEKLEDEASHLVAYDDYILNQIHAARDMGRRITGEMLRTYVLDFFGMHYAGCTFRQINGEDLEFEVKLSAKAKQDLEDFIRSEKLATPTRLTRSSTRPVRCRFESRTTVDDGSSVEVISQFHPLVRFVGKMISEREEQLRPAVGVRLSAETLGEPSLPKGEYVLAAAQWSVKGLRSTEKLVFAAARLDADAPILAAAEAERLANACALHGTDWFESRGEVALKAAASVADQRLFAQLEDDYDAFVSEIERQNNDRADLRLTNLRRELKRQLSREYEVREKHRSHGRESLVKATDGRIKALEGRAERKKIKIERARTVRPNRDEILVAVIRVD